jgi:Uma2 family endonuclease
MLILGHKMSLHYQETLEGESHLRIGPGVRHELICSRLHKLVKATLSQANVAHVLSPRTSVKLSDSHIVCPDLAMITVATGKVWLAAEIINSEDHRADTFIKKQIYDEIRLPRLWMIDPRYDNVEVYHSGAYGLALVGILAGNEVLADKLLPGFQVTMKELFAP